MWPFTRKHASKSAAPVLFTNTLSGGKEPFAPIKAGTATMYSCGPTVYSQAHIGNLRPYVFSDVAARVLGEAGYRVRRVINITDVGHLTGDNEGDANQGEDKMEKSARELGQSAKDIADRNTKLFLDDIAALNIATGDILFPRATEYVREQIAMVQALEAKGHTYRIQDGIYFDVRTFPGYGKLGGIPEEIVKNGTRGTLTDRIELAGRSRIKENEEKRNAADFALWKFSPAGARRQQEWPSPWGLGFPGWHIECSAMSKALLGTTIDIHTGGMDHIPIHHNNEIAQSESANGQPLARYWMHNAFLTMKAEKVSKSLGNVVYLAALKERNIHPLALRYLFLQAHYRTPLSFSWESIDAAHAALTRLWALARGIRQESRGASAPSELADRLIALVRDDLGTPAALAVVWEAVRDESLSPKAAWGVLEAADSVLGLSLLAPPLPKTLGPNDIPKDIQALLAERQEARAARNFLRADELRIHIEARGYRVEDGPTGVVVTRQSS